jgi:hypothetical protein
MDNGWRGETACQNASAAILKPSAPNNCLGQTGPLSGASVQRPVLYHGHAQGTIL